MAEAVEGFIEIGPGPVHYRLSAAAQPAAQSLPPLVFLHEGLGSIALWRDMPDATRRLLGGRTTLVYSRHGYGRSCVVTTPRRPDYMHREADEILPAVLRALSIERPVLIGHSDGASIALLHASTHPVHAVVAIAPHVFVERCTIEAAAASRQAFATTDLPTRMARHHTDAAATFAGWNDIWLSREFRDWNIEDVLPNIGAPILLVQGDADPYGTVAQLDAIERGAPGRCTRLLVPGAGHAPHLDQADAVTAAIRDFLS